MRGAAPPSLALAAFALAVAVTPHQGRIGYVPSTIAQEIKWTHPDDVKLLATINCMFLPQPGKSAGLKCPSGQAPKRRERAAPDDDP